MAKIFHVDVDSFSSARFGQGSGEIFIDAYEVSCRGTESRLIECDHYSYYDDDYCDHRDDVGVHCCKTLLS